MRALSIVTVFVLAATLLPVHGNSPNSKETRKKSAPETEVAPEDDFLPSFAAELKKVRTTVEDLSKKIKKTPKDANLYFSRSQLFSALGEHNKAKLDRIKAVELNPGLANEAAQLQTLTPMMCDTEVAIGSEFLRRGKYEFAELKFHSAQEADPRKPGGFIGMGAVYVALKQYPKAVESFTKAIQISTNSAAGYFQRANTYIKMGQPAKAIPDLTKAIELSDRAEAYYVRSLAYKALKKNALADEDLKKAVELDADVAKKVPAS